MAKQGQVVRFVVRPKSSTIRGWYVWAVVLDKSGKEVWSHEPELLAQSKREATRLCNDLNEELNQDLPDITEAEKQRWEE